MQRLFAIRDEPSLMVTQTTERGSVFDVGALFEIPGHDVNRAVFRHVLYSRMGESAIWEEVRDSIGKSSDLDPDYKIELLSGPLEEFCRGGAKTHHMGMLDAVTGDMFERGLPKNPSPYNVVRRFEILKPTRVDILGASLFDYSVFPKSDGYVVPLEFIVRFGITSASSVYRKYLKMGQAEQKLFEQELGVDDSLQAWQYLSRPITDFTTKFEPTDRMLSKQEALMVSSLSGKGFKDASKLAVLGAWAVRHLVEGMGLSLWDIKWEFARQGDELFYVDTIDTDSFRATLEVEFEGKRILHHCNKQAMRDYFHLLHDDWIAAINETKAKADELGVAFTELLSEGQESGTYPQTPEVPSEFIWIQQQKMTTIRDYMLERIDSAAATAALQTIAQQEVAFYRDAGKLDELLSINSLT